MQREEEGNILHFTHTKKEKREKERNHSITFYIGSCLWNTHIHTYIWGITCIATFENNEDNKKESKRRKKERREEIKKKLCEACVIIVSVNTVFFTCMSFVRDDQIGRKVIYESSSRIRCHYCRYHHLRRWRLFQTCSLGKLKHAKIFMLVA